jgi:hypothetical protein
MFTRNWCFLISYQSNVYVGGDTWAPGGGDVRLIKTQH